MRWIPRNAVLAMHAELLAEHGGLPGVRDDAAFGASLARAQHKYAYEQADVFALAAAHGFAFAKNHVFNDGNKRIALTTTDVFLRMNGYRLIASELEATATILSLACGDLDEAALADWIRANAQPLEE